jgi:hypothetical protein
MWRELNDERARCTPPLPPIVMPPLSIYEATRIAAATDVVRFFPLDDQLVAEMRRVCGCFDEKGLPIRRAEPVLRQLGQVFPKTSQPEPVIWPKGDAPESGVVAPEVAARLDLGSIGRRMA